MRTSQDLLDVERRIRGLEVVRQKRINNPFPDPDGQARAMELHDYALSLLHARKAKIRAEIGDVPTSVYAPPPTEVNDGWEDFK